MLVAGGADGKRARLRSSARAAGRSNESRSDATRSSGSAADGVEYQSEREGSLGVQLRAAVVEPPWYEGVVAAVLVWLQL